MSTSFDAVKRYVFERLQKELSADLFFHDLHHTKDDVLPAAERLAEKEGVTGNDLLLLRTAALYHDIGYVEQYDQHELISAKIASETLPGFGYSSEQIDRVRKIILATQMQEVDGGHVQLADSDDKLQKIMCDADLDALGRDDCFMLGHNLRREWNSRGMSLGLREWYEFQLKFLENHTYFTEAARSLREPGKQKSIEELKTLLGRT
jgi:uncharacterized protein